MDREVTDQLLSAGEYPIRGWGPFRPEGHDVVVGRRDTFVPPGGRISLAIEDHAFAGHTFGVNHDNFVGYWVAMGAPDALINQWSMPFIYADSVLQESANMTIWSINQTMGTDLSIPFIHTDPVQ